jgi:RNA polymerase sigma factor (sigma-70 family)
VQQSSDDNILALISNSNTLEKGFRLLMQSHQEKLYYHIRRIVFDHDDANDVMQNTMIKVFRNIQGFKGDSKLSTWLYRIATNESITFINSRKNTESIDPTNMIAKVESMRADSYFEGDDIQVLLEAALQILPEKQRIVFNMRYYDNMSYDEISEVLGTSVGALKASYHHAAKKIEAFITKKEII